MKSLSIVLTLVLTIMAVSAPLTQSKEKTPAPHKTLPTSFSCGAISQKVLQGSSSQQAKKLFATYWDQLMHNYPEWAMNIGYAGVDYSQWTDLSIRAIEARKLQTPCFLKLAKSISRKGLSAQDRVSLQILQYQLEDAIQSYSFPGEYLALNQMGGPQQNIADTLQWAPKNSVQDFENLLKRLQTVDVLIEQTQQLLQLGLETKVTPPQVVMADVPRQFDAILTDKIEESPLYKSFADIRLDIPAAEKSRIQSQAKHWIESKVYPALKKLRSFVVKDYIPQCRTSLAASALPNGKAWYAYAAQSSTTTAMTPAQIHELGLSEVQRIRQEMALVKEQAQFKGSLQEFDQFLQKDKQFYFTNAKDLLTGYREIAKRIDPELPKLFGKLPRLTYGVEAMPAYKAQSAPAAYYMGGSEKQGRAGFFEANVSNLSARAKWAMEALTLHEAVPGHHLQIALAQEMEALPDFRKESGFTAYAEGWGLYAEGLGDQLGMFKDVYSKYGQLNYEMWRAIRLVVDTGLHDKMWSRDQAIQFFKDNSAFPQKHIEDEVDRYIVWPGQALAYKIGQLKFKALREQAQVALGDKYSIRDYHDFVLGLGAVPMGVLDSEFDLWLKSKTTKVK